MPPRPSIERRAGFCSRVCAVSGDRYAVVLLYKITHEVMQCRPLRSGEIAIGQTGLIDATHKTDTNAVLVVALSVRPFLLVRPARFDIAVTPDDVVIPNIGPALVDVPLPDVSSADVLCGLRRRAVDDDLADLSH